MGLATPLDSNYGVKNEKTEHSFKPLKVSPSPPSGEEIVIALEKVSFSGQNSHIPTKRNDLYRRVCLVEFYQDLPSVSMVPKSKILLSSALHHYFMD